MFRTQTHQGSSLRRTVAAAGLSTIVACGLTLVRPMPQASRETAYLQTNGQVDANYLAPRATIEQGYSKSTASVVQMQMQHMVSSASAGEVFVSNLIDSARLVTRFIGPPEPVSYWEMNS